MNMTQACGCVSLDYRDINTLEIETPYGVLELSRSEVARMLEDFNQ